MRPIRSNKAKVHHTTGAQPMSNTPFAAARAVANARAVTRCRHENL